MVTSENTAVGPITLSATETQGIGTSGSPTYSVTGAFTPEANSSSSYSPFTVAPGKRHGGGKRNSNMFTLTPATNWVGDFDLVAHADDTNSSFGAIHDALPFTMQVSGQADVEVTTTDNVGGSSVTNTSGSALSGGHDHLHGQGLQQGNRQHIRRFAPRQLPTGFDGELSGVTWTATAAGWGHRLRRQRHRNARQRRLHDK